MCKLLCSLKMFKFVINYDTETHKLQLAIWERKLLKIFGSIKMEKVDKEPRDGRNEQVSESNMRD